MKINLLVTLAIVLGGIAQENRAATREQSFDSDWRFFCGDAAGVEAVAFDDETWRVLDLPHDWSIEDAPPPAQGKPKLAVPTDGWRFMRGDDLNWANPIFVDSSWQTVNLPASFGSLLSRIAAYEMGWFLDQSVESGLGASPHPLVSVGPAWLELEVAGRASTSSI